MRTQEAILDPKRFIRVIQSQSEFATQLPTDRPFGELPPDQKQIHFQRAIASSAISIARRVERAKGGHNVDVQLYTLIAELPTFYETKRTINSLLDTYGDYAHMPLEEKLRYNKSKETQIAFNTTLREVINTGASKFNFNDLLTFMTTMHAASGGRETTKEFYGFARESLVGIRNEMAFEQVLMASGLDYEVGSVEQDAEGGDFIVNGVPIDVKASKDNVARKQQKAIEAGRNPNLIVWSHIDFEDYEGSLTLPYSWAESTVEKVLPDIRQALASEGVELAA